MRRKPIYHLSASSLRVSGTLAETDSYYLVFSFYDTADGKPGKEITSSGMISCCGPTQAFSVNLTLPSNPTLYMGIYAVSMANRDNQYYYYDYEQSLSVNPAMRELVAPFKVR